MTAPWQVGDMAMVVKPIPCCKADGAIGAIFKVTEINTAQLRCIQCGHLDHTLGLGGYLTHMMCVSRCIKLTPGTPLEAIDTEREVETLK
jgi:hypothetical protein